MNPASDDVATVERLLRMLDRVREALEIPTQICVLAHVTQQMEAMRRGAPVDLVFQSIAGTEAANRRSASTSPCSRKPSKPRGTAARRKRDVLRDRPGQRSVRQRAPWRGPADVRSARLRGSPRVSRRCW